MSNNQYSTFCTAFLFIGLLALPFLSFSQQQEEPKRVTIVVTAKEVTPQKEIVQLPADNLPKATVAAFKKNTTNSSKIIATPKETVASNPITSKKIVEAKKIPVAVAKKAVPTVKTTETAKNKQEVRQELKPAQPLEEKTATPIAKAETTIPNVDVSKEVKQIGDEVATTIKLKAGKEEVLNVTHSSKVNSFSYIWIGIFLIVAGLVLGLLFGKPAFLISFVGVVFITLGLVI